MAENNNNVHRKLEDLKKLGDNVRALNAKVAKTLENVGVTKGEAARVGAAMEKAEKNIYNMRIKTREATRTLKQEQKERYNTKLKGFMSIRDPSKRYSNAENSMVKDRAGKAIYGYHWNLTKHAPNSGWPAEGGGKRKGRKSRKTRKGRKGTRRH
jgi:hypothetical protein